MPAVASQTDSPGPALRDYALAELAAAIRALAAHGGRIHAGVHLSRKAMRRTRATLRLGGDLGPGARLIDRKLRRLNRGLSALRDAHALVETLDRLVGRPHRDEVQLCLRRARRTAAQRRAGLTHQAEVLHRVAESRALLVTLRAALIGLPWDGISMTMLEEALSATTRDGAAARDRACTRGGDRDWHRWRRRMRRLSQQHRACVAAGVEVATTMFDKSLTEQLGVMQDLTLLLEHCGANSPFSKEDAATLRDFAKRALSRQRRRVVSVAPDPGASNAP
jgi:hypothetical protein